jgi:hypothetical protein
VLVNLFTANKAVSAGTGSCGSKHYSTEATRQSCMPCKAEALPWLMLRTALTRQQAVTA